MKASNNGLTKHWEVSKSHVAFYSGNKVSFVCFCIFRVKFTLFFAKD